MRTTTKNSKDAGRPEAIPVKMKSLTKQVVATIKLLGTATLDRGYRTAPENAQVRRPSPSAPHRLFVGNQDIAGLDPELERRVAIMIARLDMLHPPFTERLLSIGANAAAVPAQHPGAIVVTIEARWVKRPDASSAAGKKAIADWCGAYTHLSDR